MFVTVLCTGQVEWLEKVEIRLNRVSHSLFNEGGGNGPPLGRGCDQVGGIPRDYVATVGSNGSVLFMVIRRQLV